MDIISPKCGTCGERATIDGNPLGKPQWLCTKCDPSSRPSREFSLIWKTWSDGKLSVVVKKAGETVAVHTGDRSYLERLISARGYNK